MPMSRDRGLVGLSAHSPIDLVSEDEEMQVPVASGRPRVHAPVAQLVRYNTRSVTRTQAAETPIIGPRSTALRAGTSANPGSQAHTRAATSNTPTPTASGSTAEITLKPRNKVRHRRSKKRNGNKAAAATSLRKLSPELASSNRKLGADTKGWLIRTQNPTQFEADHTPVDALELSSLKPISNGSLKGVNSEVLAQASVPRHDLAVNESGIGEPQSSSSGAPETSGIPYRDGPSSARSDGEEDLVNGRITARLLSRHSIRTLRTAGSREHFAISAARDSGENLLTPRSRMSMNSNDGAAASRQLIDQHNSSLETNLAGTLNTAGAQLPKTPAWPAGWGLRDNAFDKRSVTSPWQPTDNALCKPKRDEMPPTSMRNSEENGSTLPRALPRPTVIERAVVTRHQETTFSRIIETPQSFSDTSRPRRTLDRILPADRTLTRATDLADSLKPAFLARKRKERTECQDIATQRMTNRYAGSSTSSVNTQATVTRTSRTERLQTTQGWRRGGRGEEDLVVVTGPHRNFNFWKQKAAEELQIGAEMNLISAAVAVFDKRQIQTVVPNRYLRTKRSLRRIVTFPGTIELILNAPITAVKNAYREHTAEKLDTSRVVFWTDGSAATRGHFSKRTRGFAVAWRRSTSTGWGRWEAMGFQAQGELPDSDSMETLAVMKAIAKSYDLAHEMPGQLKAVAIYTDSTSAIHVAQNPKHPLGLHIIRKARMLTKLGLTLSLHWCPGHSGVSDILSLHQFACHAKQNRFPAMN
ncbi:hypothetical protein PMIN04_008598 [Paraphaeosphaeria minitans]